MARERSAYRVCLTSDEDEPDSKPDDDPNDLDFAPAPLLRRPKPAVKAPPLPTAAASPSENPHLLRPPNYWALPHDIVSARQHLLTKMSALGHKPVPRYDMMIWGDGCTPTRGVVTMVVLLMIWGDGCTPTRGVVTMVVLLMIWGDGCTPTRGVVTMVVLLMIWGDGCTPTRRMVTYY
jgi:hypothetical protein